MTMTRGRWILTILLAGSLTAAAALTYKQWPRLSRRLGQPAPAATPAENQVSSVPPYATKEPERYQARRLINTSEGAPGLAVTTTESILIARDGENRREEFNKENEGLVYLEIPSGHFLLFPARKLYADLNVVNKEQPDNVPDYGALDLSPDRLLHEGSEGARYENLGVENIAGRKTTKYRVTPGEPGGETSGGSVTLIWIDDELQMPIKSETNSANTDHQVKITMELQDITLVVDPRQFQLPADYAKVDYAVLRSETGRVRGTPGSDNAKTKSP
jgi:hypothetical protein